MRHLSDTPAWHTDSRRAEAASKAQGKKARANDGGGGGKRKRSLSSLKPGDLDGDSVEEVGMSSEDEHGEDNDLLLGDGVVGSRHARAGGGASQGVGGRGKGGGGLSPGARPSKKSKKGKQDVEEEEDVAIEEDEEMFGWGDADEQGASGRKKGRKGKKGSPNTHALVDADAFHRYCCTCCVCVCVCVCSVTTECVFLL